MTTRKKPSALEEQLARENAFLRGALARQREDPGDIPFTACDNSCLVAQAHGMATNGGCRCPPVVLRRAIQWWRRKALFETETVRMLRGDCELCQELYGDLTLTFPLRCALRAGHTGEHSQLNPMAIADEKIGRLQHALSDVLFSAQIKKWEDLREIYALPDARCHEIWDLSALEGHLHGSR